MRLIPNREPFEPAWTTWRASKTSSSSPPDNKASNDRERERLHAFCCGHSLRWQREGAGKTTGRSAYLRWHRLTGERQHCGPKLLGLVRDLGRCGIEGAEEGLDAEG